MGVYHIAIEEGGSIVFERQHSDANCMVYFFGGSAKGNVQLGEKKENVKFAEAGVLKTGSGVGESEMKFTLFNSGTGRAELLILEGKPIGEEVVARGPFVTSSTEQMYDTMMRARDPSSVFNVWPHDTPGPVHTGKERFATYGGDVDNPDVPDKIVRTWPAGNKERLHL